MLRRKRRISTAISTRVGCRGALIPWVLPFAACVLVLAPAAHAGTVTIGGGSGLVINDQGASDPEPARATPYPSVLNVTGLTGVVDRVTATIVDFNHTCPQDVDLLLGLTTGLLMVLPHSSTHRGTPRV
jgi:hypothetical protein